MTNDPLLPCRILPSDSLGQQAWRRRVEVLRAAHRQLRTFNPKKPPRPRVTKDTFMLQTRNEIGQRDLTAL